MSCLFYKKGGGGGRAQWVMVHGGLEFSVLFLLEAAQKSSSNQAKKAIYSYIACLEYYLQLKDEGIGILYIISFLQCRLNCFNYGNICLKNLPITKLIPIVEFF